VAESQAQTMVDAVVAAFRDAGLGQEQEARGALVPGRSVARDRRRSRTTRPGRDPTRLRDRGDEQRLIDGNRTTAVLQYSLGRILLAAASSARSRRR
jgi:molybdopterin-guanine dinucleotide biosynthesis protein